LKTIYNRSRIQTKLSCSSFCSSRGIMSLGQSFRWIW